MFWRPLPSADSRRSKPRPSSVTENASSSRFSRDGSLRPTRPRISRRSGGPRGCRSTRRLPPPGGYRPMPSAATSTALGPCLRLEGRQQARVREHRRVDPTRQVPQCVEGVRQPFLQLAQHRALPLGVLRRRTRPRRGAPSRRGQRAAAGRRRAGCARSSVAPGPGRPPTAHATRQGPSTAGSCAGRAPGPRDRPRAAPPWSSAAPEASTGSGRRGARPDGGPGTEGVHFVERRQPLPSRWIGAGGLLRGPRGGGPHLRVDPEPDDSTGRPRPFGEKPRHPREDLSGRTSRRRSRKTQTGPRRASPACRRRAGSPRRRVRGSVGRRRRRSPSRSARALRWLR